VAIQAGAIPAIYPGPLITARHACAPRAGILPGSVP
jgi:hypothetical protein